MLIQFLQLWKPEASETPQFLLYFLEIFAAISAILYRTIVLGISAYVSSIRLLLQANSIQAIKIMANRGRP